MSTNTELSRLEFEVRRLEEAFQATNRAMKRVSTASLAIGAGLFIVITTFVLINYFKFRSEMTEDKLARSLEKQLIELSPTALKEAHRLGTDLLPVYAAELKQQVEAAAPQIATKIEEEMDQLVANVLATTHDALLKSEKRVLEKTQHVVFDAYPQLKDPKEQAALTAELHATCDEAVGKAILHFDSLFTKDVDRLQKVILSFNVTDTNEPTVELHKRFIHLWLQLLDQEIMEL